MKNNSKCSVKGCDRPVKVVKHGLCSAHLQRYYRHNEPGSPRIAEKKVHVGYREVKELKV